MGFINQFPYSDFHELNLDWVIKQVKLNLDSIKELQEKMDEIEILTEDQINSMINSAIAENNIDLYNRLTDLKAEITREYTALITNQISTLKTYLDNQDIYYDNQAKSYASTALADSKAYTDQTVLNYTMMINPITGQYDDVRVVVDDIIAYFHSESSLTAAEYDALDLTAQAYDNYQLTAFNYDFNGKNLLV